MEHHIRSETHEPRCVTSLDGPIAGSGRSRGAAAASGASAHLYHIRRCAGRQGAAEELPARSEAADPRCVTRLDRSPGQAGRAVPQWLPGASAEIRTNMRGPAGDSRGAPRAIRGRRPPMYDQTGTIPRSELPRAQPRCVLRGRLHRQKKQRINFTDFKIS